MNRIDEIKADIESMKRIRLMSGKSGLAYAGMTELLDDLLSEIDRLTAERDAAVRDLTDNLNCDVCDVCAHSQNWPQGCIADCENCKQKCVCGSCSWNDKWEWRGPCAENANPSEIPTP